MFKPYRTLIGFLPRLWSNWITMLGTAIVSASGLTILVALSIDLTSSRGLNNYAAAIIYLVMPALLALGLLMIPLGLWRERRRSRTAGSPATEADADTVLAAFTRAMESQTVRRRVGFVLLMTVLNVFIFSTVSYRAVTFMDTPAFCGTTCHKVMQPEFDAYNLSPHSRVSCVECHIGSGAQSLLKAKLTGLRQVWGVATGTFHRPIGTPVHNLRPATETCGNCHQANRQSGTRMDFRVHFKEDEANTPQVTAMLMNVGGKDARTGDWSGIHFHASTRYSIRYEYLDARREIVGRIQKLDGDEIINEWLPANYRADNAVVGIRTMDCIDCHNRATHVYDASPMAAVTRALSEGQLDRKVPWLYQASVRALTGATPARDKAQAHFRQALEAQYRFDHGAQKPSAEKLEQAARALTALYSRNVYPGMKLTWGNYRSQIGHGGPDPGQFKGQCFRCHAGNHKTAEGQVLTSKCEICHEVVAKDELPDDLPDEIKPLLRL